MTPTADRINAGYSVFSEKILQSVHYQQVNTDNFVYYFEMISLTYCLYML